MAEALELTCIEEGPVSRTSRFFEEYKAFVKRGNVLDLAVGVVIGVAFGSITKSLVDDIINPILGLVIGRVDLANWFVTLREGSPAGPYQTLDAARTAGAVTINYGAFLNTIINFIVVALAMFVAIKAVQNLNSSGEPESTPATVEPRRCPYCRTEIAENASRCPACTSELTSDEETSEPTEASTA
jgi:large conductance mechanosensitive channel